MAYILRYLTFLAVSLLLFTQEPLNAQTTSSDSAKDDRSFTVYAPAASDACARLYYLDGARKRVKLTFRANRRSAPITIIGAPKVLIFGVERIDPATQQKTYVPIAQTPWPKSSLTTLVIFTVSDGANPQVQATAVNDGLKEFPLRSVRVFNATGVKLLGKVAVFQGEVPLGISPAYPYTVQSEDPTVVGVFPMAFAINDPKEGSRVLYTGNGEAWPHGRSLIFILPPSQGFVNLQIRVLVDS